MTSPFSFHCMICFEGFDTDTRFPVVLPCGHTYVCNECAKRLDKCMECRTPLFELIPQSNECTVVSGVPEQLPAWSTRTLGTSRSGGRRGGRGGGRNRKPPPPKKRRIQLPKNVVLLSLIEATELATENVQGQEHEPSLHNSPMINPSILDLEADEEEKIKTGTSLAISDCGTYAVAAREGLEIFPNRPESLVQNSEEDLDTLVRFYNRDNNANAAISDDKKTADDEGTRKDNLPARLSWGDRIQIVSMQNDWAKLARGYGYIRAGTRRLVKVGGSVDRSCKLEAMLRLMSLRRKELRVEQKKIDNQFISFMNELQVSLMSDEDLTVIAADTFHKNLENNDPSGGGSTSTTRVRTRGVFPVPLDTKIPDQVRTSSTLVRQPEPERSNNTYQDSTPLKPRFTVSPATPPGASSKGSFFCSSSDVLNAVLPLSSSNTQPPALPSVTRSPAIAREYNNMSQQQRNQFSNHHNYPQTPRHDSRNVNYVEDTPTRLLTSVTHPSPSALRAGARAWREMHGRPASNHIDFRTGMSGHSALFSSSAHTHDYIGATQRFFTGMSSHTGLTMWKAPKFPFSLTSSATSDEGEDHSRSTVHPNQSDSM